ncbi:MAG: hypothetical protein Kow0079_04860 [Vicingaceae bacterium]
MVITKKNILLLILSVSFYFIKGQSNIINKKITSGIAYNTLSEKIFLPISVSYSYYNRVSPYIGLGFDFKFNEKSYFQFVPYYVQRGVRFNYTYESPNYYLNVDQIFTLHYASIPISFYYKFSKFSFGTGVEGSFLLQANSSIEYKEINGYMGTKESYSLKNKDYINLYQAGDLGYVFYIGYDLKWFKIDFNYFHGIIPPPKFNVFPAQRFDFQYTYQQTFRLGISYFLNKQ